VDRSASPTGLGPVVSQLRRVAETAAQRALRLHEDLTPARLAFSARVGLEAGALAALFAGGASSAMLATLMGHAPATATQLFVGASCALFALIVCVLGRRLPRSVRDGLLVAAAVLDGVLVATARTSSEASIAAYAVPWLAVYYAWFCSPKGAGRHLAILGVTLFGGLTLSGQDAAAVTWLVSMVSACGVTLALARVRARLHAQATTDALTGLPHRAGLREAVADLEHRPDRHCAVVVLDLDGFKQVNDTFGHAAGDQLLKDLTAAWQRVLRPGDVLARTGGDEFVLLLPGANRAATDRVLRRLSAAHVARWSAGSALWRPTESFETCLRRADARLYEDKVARRAPAVSVEQREHARV
jgi:diguanylate cyclase (GGDEF)-like protein